MPNKSYREESRREWVLNVPDGGELRNDDLKLGAMLRMADAVEKMAGPFARLVEENERLKTRLSDRLEYIRRLERQLAATRGVVSRMKRAAKATS